MLRKLLTLLTIFLSIAESLNIDHPKIDYALKLLHETHIGSIREMKIISVTEAEIQFFIFMCCINS
jgi:hypothetical protein